MTKDNDNNDSAANRKYAATQFALKLASELKLEDKTELTPENIQKAIDTVEKDYPANRTLLKELKSLQKANKKVVSPDDDFDSEESSITSPESLAAALESRKVTLTSKDLKHLDFEKLIDGKKPKDAQAALQNLDLSELTQPEKDRVALKFAAGMKDNNFAKKLGVKLGDEDLSDHDMSADHFGKLKELAKKCFKGENGTEVARILEVIASQRTECASSVSESLSNPWSGSTMGRDVLIKMDTALQYAAKKYPADKWDIGRMIASHSDSSIKAKETIFEPVKNWERIRDYEKSRD